MVCRKSLKTEPICTRLKKVGSGSDETGNTEGSLGGSTSVLRWGRVSGRASWGNWSGAVAGGVDWWRRVDWCVGLLGWVDWRRLNRLGLSAGKTLAIVHAMALIPISGTILRKQ